MRTANIVVLAGIINSDIRINETKNGRKIASFFLRWSEKYGDEWNGGTIGVTAFEFGKMSYPDILTKYYPKGSPVEVRGKLSNEKYTNKDGVEVNTIKLIAEEIFIMPKGTESGGGYNETSSTEDYNPFS